MRSLGLLEVIMNICHVVLPRLVVLSERNVTRDLEHKIMSSLARKLTWITLSFMHQNNTNKVLASRHYDYFLGFLRPGSTRIDTEVAFAVISQMQLDCGEVCSDDKSTTIQHVIREQQKHVERHSAITCVRIGDLIV